MQKICLLVGFLGEFRHNFYAQKEDPGTPNGKLILLRSLPKLSMVVSGSPKRW